MPVPEPSPGIERVSYSIFPPRQDGGGGGGSGAQPLPTFRVPQLLPLEEKLHRSGPLLLPLEDAQAAGAPGAAGAHDAARPASRAGARDGARSRGKRSHPMHTLAVTALALDVTTAVEGDDSDDEDGDAGHEDDDSGPSRRPARPPQPYPRGILYTAGRDGLTAAWDLRLPMQQQHAAHPHAHGPFGSAPGTLDGHDEQHDSFGDDAGLFPHRRDARGVRVVQPFWHPRARRRPPAFRQCIQSHTDWVNDVVLCNSNQTLISASSDRTVKAWNPHDAASQLQPHTLGHHEDYVKCLAAARGAPRIFSGGFDRCVKLWDISDGRAADGAPLFEIGPGNGCESSVYALATDDAARIVAVATTENTVAVWDVRSHRQVAKLIGHTNNVKSLLLSADGQYLLSGSSDETIRLWSIGEQRCFHTFEHHSDSVWSLYSDDPRLDVFYSGDRQGYVCKVDWQRCAEVEEGECVVLCRDAPPERERAGAAQAQNGTGAATPFKQNSTSAAAWSRRHKQLTHSGIHKIVAVDDAYLFTASNSSSVKIWHDVPRRIDREARYLARRDDALALASPQSQALAGSPGPSHGLHRPSPLRNAVGQEDSPRAQATPFHGADGASAPPQPHEQGQGMARLGSYGFGGGSLEDPTRMNSIPFDSLVNLCPTGDIYIGHGSLSLRHSMMYSRTQDAGTESALAHSVPHTAIPPRASIQVGRPSITSVRDAALTSSTSIRFDGTPDVRHAASVHADSEPEDASLMLAHRLRTAFENRELAEEATPLYDSPAEILEGAHGLIRSSMLNDRRHVLTIDTAGEVAIWDIVRCACLGRFDEAGVREVALDQLPDKDEATIAAARADWKSVVHPGDTLDAVRERVEGCGATPLWCTADTRAGVLTVHLQEPRCFDAEIYLDELDFLSADTFREDERANVGKMLLRSLLCRFYDIELATRGARTLHVLAAEAADAFSTASSASPAPLTLVAQSPMSPAIVSPASPLSPGGTANGLDRMLRALQDGEPPADYFTPKPAAPAPVVEVQPEQTGSGFLNKFKRGKKPQKDVKVEPVAETVNAEPARILTAREILCRPLQPPVDLPTLPLPMDTAVMFAESSADAGQFAVSYRGAIGSLGSDAARLELCAPPWLLSLLFQGSTTQRDPVKTSFVLEPSMGDDAMPALPSGNARLTATQMLRVKKIAAYVAERLHLQLARTSTDSIASSRRPSATAAAVEGPLAMTAAPTAPAHETIQIRCNGIALPPQMTLAQCRRFIWRSSGDIKLEYARM